MLAERSCGRREAAFKQSADGLAESPSPQFESRFALGFADGLTQKSNGIRMVERRYTTVDDPGQEDGAASSVSRAVVGHARKKRLR